MHIISQSQNGNPDAFAALFEQYKNLVYKTAYLMLGDAAEAEDALQDVFIHVYRSLKSYDPAKGAFTTWLHRITINHCLNRRRRYQPVCQPLDEQLASESFTSRFAEQEVVWNAVQQLSDKQRAVVILRYYNDLPYADIASILDIPVGTVKSRLNLALRTLLEALNTPGTEMEQLI